MWGMPHILNLSSHQLKRAIEIKTEIERLASELANLAGKGAVSQGPRRRRMSRAGRARIAAAQRARWAKQRAVKAKPVNKKRKMSAAARAKLSAMAKERWKKAKSAGKTKL